eukprot:634143_1
MALQELPKLMRSKSILEIQDMLRNRSILYEKKLESVDEGLLVDKTYKMPLEFMYHNKTFVFADSPSKECKELVSFHKVFDKYQTSIRERYGFAADYPFRMNIDSNACLVVFAIDADNNNVMAMLTLFDVSNSTEAQYKIEKELALVVLPPYQRRHIATDLMRLTWNLFANEKDECWVYVLNSRKSGMFWRKFRQWYPHVRFRLVKP